MAANTLRMAVRDLKVDLKTEAGLLPAVRGVDFELREGRTLAVVGESGSGKTMLGFTLMRLVPPKLEHRTTGEILYYGNGNNGAPQNLVEYDPRGSAIRRIRGKEIAMIFQEPMSSLSPVHTVGNQMMEAIRLHQQVAQKEARELGIELLKKVNLPHPKRQFSSYPHELSGGMRQRVMIAMALSCNPKILIADEPTTALDVTIQAQILELLEQLKEETGLSVLLVTHDLGVVAQVADDVAVMYLGEFVETSDVHTLFANPSHPYTQGLMESIPTGDRSSRLNPIRGMVPDPLHVPRGCLFSNRCPHFYEQCRETPPMHPLNDHHNARCWLRVPGKEPVSAGQL